MLTSAVHLVGHSLHERLHHYRDPGLAGLAATFLQTGHLPHQVPRKTPGLHCRFHTTPIRAKSVP